MGEIKAELNAELQTHIAFEIPLFGGIPGSGIRCGKLGNHSCADPACHLADARTAQASGRKQIAAEMLVGFINNFCRDTLGDKYWRTFAPYLGTVGLYLALANMAGLFGVTPPTKDLNVTAGLAIMSALLIYGSQFRFHGLRGGLKKFSEPVSVVTPLNIMEIGIRPLVALHATVRQHFRRIRHHGAGQNGRSGRCPHSTEPVFRCIRRHDTGDRICIPDNTFLVGIA